MKGKWCEHSPTLLFCQEEAGCGSCEIYLASRCPIGLTKSYCGMCDYSKEGLCDYPYIGNVKVEVDDAEKV